MYHNKQMHAFFTEQLKTVIDINISVGKAPPRGVSDFLDLETAKENQLDRFKEEYKELLDATDAVQHADALCDIFVTLGGYIYLLNQLYRTPTGVDDSVTPIDAYLMSADEMASRVKDDLTYAYAVMAQVCKSIIMMVEVDCLGYLKTINDNNLSKFPKTLAECEESINWYQQNTNESEIVTKPLIGMDGYWLCRTVDNKYMKPKPFYKDPDVSNHLRIV